MKIRNRSRIRRQLDRHPPLSKCRFSVGEADIFGGNEFRVDCEVRMQAGARLVTSVDVDDRAAGENVAVSAKHELELVDGRRVPLLDDRGWASSAGWERTSEETVRETARVVVGPDEPAGGQSRSEAEADHWAHLASAALRQDVSTSASELERLPHDVEISDRLLLRLNTR